jgi:hypothetical protein
MPQGQFSAKTIEHAKGFAMARLSTYVKPFSNVKECVKFIAEHKESEVEIQALINYAKRYQGTGGDYRHKDDSSRLFRMSNVAAAAAAATGEQKEPKDSLDFNPANFK